MSGNPYYVEPNNTRMQNILALAGLATQLYGMKQRGDIAEGEEQIGQERNRLTADEIRQRGTIADREAGLKEQDIGVRREAVSAERAKVPLHQQNFGYGDQAVLRIQLGKLGIKDDSPLVQRAKELADHKEVTKMDAYQSYHDDPEMQQAAVDSLQKKMEARATKEPGYLESREGKQDYQLLQQISTEDGWHKAIDSAFKNTVQSVKQTEMNSKAAILAAQNEQAKNRYIQTDRGLYDTANKTLVADTGKLFAPERPVSVGPGATLVDPTDNKPIYTNPNRPAGADRPVSVAPGGTLVNPTTGQPIYKAPKEQKETTPAETRATAKDIANAETMIGTNATKQEVGGKVDFFNQYAEKPYAYQWKKGTLYGGEWSKITLPKDSKGRQITAKTVYDWAVDKGRTYEDVLNEILEAAKARQQTQQNPTKLRGLGMPTTSIRNDYTVRY